MKKSLVIIITGGVLLAALVLIAVFIARQGTFFSHNGTLSNGRKYTFHGTMSNNFSLEENVKFDSGESNIREYTAEKPVTTAKKAAEAAEKIYCPQLTPEEEAQGVRTSHPSPEQMSYEVYYDKVEDCWAVTEKLSPGYAKNLLDGWPTVMTIKRNSTKVMLHLGWVELKGTA